MSKGTGKSFFGSGITEITRVVPGSDAPVMSEMDGYKASTGAIEPIGGPRNFGIKLLSNDEFSRSDSTPMFTFKHNGVTYIAAQDEDGYVRYMRHTDTKWSLKLESHRIPHQINQVIKCDNVYALFTDGGIYRLVPGVYLSGGKLQTSTILEPLASDATISLTVDAEPSSSYDFLEFDEWNNTILDHPGDTILLPEFTKTISIEKKLVIEAKKSPKDIGQWLYTGLGYIYSHSATTAPNFGRSDQMVVDVNTDVDNPGKLYVDVRELGIELHDVLDKDNWWVPPRGMGRTPTLSNDADSKDDKNSLKLRSIHIDAGDIVAVYNKPFNWPKNSYLDYWIKSDTSELYYKLVPSWTTYGILSHCDEVDGWDDGASIVNGNATRRRVTGQVSDSKMEIRLLANVPANSYLAVLNLSPENQRAAINDLVRIKCWTNANSVYNRTSVPIRMVFSTEYNCANVKASMPLKMSSSLQETDALLNNNAIGGVIKSIGLVCDGVLNKDVVLAIDEVYMAPYYAHSNTATEAVNPQANEWALRPSFDPVFSECTGLMIVDVAVKKPVRSVTTHFSHVYEITYCTPENKKLNRYYLPPLKAGDNTVTVKTTNDRLASVKSYAIGFDEIYKDSTITFGSMRIEESGAPRPTLAWRTDEIGSRQEYAIAYAYMEDDKYVVTIPSTTMVTTNEITEGDRVTLRIDFSDQVTWAKYGITKILLLRRNYGTATFRIVHSSPVDAPTIASDGYYEYIDYGGRGRAGVDFDEARGLSEIYKDTTIEPPPTSNIGLYDNARLYISGDTTPTAIRVSNWNEPWYFPQIVSDESASGDGMELDGYSKTGSELRGIVSWGGEKLVFLDNEFFLLHGQAWADPWRFQRANAVGLSDVHTFADCDSMAIWHWNDDFYGYSGERIGVPIGKPCVDGSKVDLTKPLQAIYNDKKYILLCHYDNKQSLVIYDLHTKGWYIRHVQAELVGLTVDESSSTVYGINEQGHLVELFSGILEWDGEDYVKSKFSITTANWLFQAPFTDSRVQRVVFDIDAECPLDTYVPPDPPEVFLEDDEVIVIDTGVGEWRDSELGGLVSTPVDGPYGKACAIEAGYNEIYQDIDSLDKDTAGLSFMVNGSGSLVFKLGTLDGQGDITWEYSRQIEVDAGWNWVYVDTYYYDLTEINIVGIEILGELTAVDVIKAQVIDEPQRSQTPPLQPSVPDNLYVVDKARLPEIWMKPNTGWGDPAEEPGSRLGIFDVNYVEAYGQDCLNFYSSNPGPGGSALIKPIGFIDTNIECDKIDKLYIRLDLARSDMTDNTTYHPPDVAFGTKDQSGVPDWTTSLTAMPVDDIYPYWHLDSFVWFVVDVAEWIISYGDDTDLAAADAISIWVGRDYYQLNVNYDMIGATFVEGYDPDPDPDEDDPPVPQRPPSPPIIKPVVYEEPLYPDASCTIESCPECELSVTVETLSDTPITVGPMKIKLTADKQRYWVPVGDLGSLGFAAKIKVEYEGRFPPHRINYIGFEHDAGGKR